VLEELADLWNRAMGPAFPMDLRLLRQNTLEHPSFDPAGIFLEGQGFALACRGPERGHIEALGVAPEARRRGLGRRLLERALEWLGPGPVRAGAGPAHFFPGVPEEMEPARRLLEAHGFRPTWKAHDLVRTLNSPPPPPAAGLGPCRRGEEPALLDFLQREFPGRWLQDTRRRLEIEPQDVVLARQGAKVVGFCHIFHPGSAVLGPSVYWRGLLGPAWGGLGPVGVAAGARGQGLGRALLQAALHHLWGRGARTIAVDWTGLPDFYARLGFRIWKTYQGMER
jgi:GNAT superfamily N-acetyltransferase